MQKGCLYCEENCSPEPVFPWGLGRGGMVNGLLSVGNLIPPTWQQERH